MNMEDKQIYKEFRTYINHFIIARGLNDEKSLTIMRDVIEDKINQKNNE